MIQIITLVFITIGILYLFKLSNNNETDDNKFKNLFNKTKEFLFITCMLIISYQLNNSSCSISSENKIPDVYTENFKF